MITPTRALVVATLAACGGASTAADVDLTAEAIGDAACAVCGMIVGEQPAPRGQVVYRDGTHAHVCSLGDLRALVQAPSPRGTPRAVYVEALEASFDPAGMDTGPRPWVSASEAWFVFGAERPLVMGVPILSFEDEATAGAFAERFGTRPVRWTDVAETPFDTVPPSARP